MNDTAMSEIVQTALGLADESFRKDTEPDSAQAIAYAAAALAAATVRQADALERIADALETNRTALNIGVLVATIERLISAAGNLKVEQP